MLKTTTGSASTYLATNRTVLDALLDLQVRESVAAEAAVAGALDDDEAATSEWLCACGLPLHYRDRSVQAFVESVIAERGSYVIATIDGRAFEVPRHYIALHGIADDLDPDALAFRCVASPASRLASRD